MNCPCAEMPLAYRYIAHRHLIVVSKAATVPGSYERGWTVVTTVSTHEDRHAHPCAILTLKPMSSA